MLCAWGTTIRTTAPQCRAIFESVSRGSAKEVKGTGRRTSPGTFVNLALDINSYLTFKTSPGGTCRIQIPAADSRNLHCPQKLHLLP